MCSKKRKTEGDRDRERLKNKKGERWGSKTERKKEEGGRNGRWKKWREAGRKRDCMVQK